MLQAGAYSYFVIRTSSFIFLLLFPAFLKPHRILNLSITIVIHGNLLPYFDVADGPDFDDGIFGIAPVARVGIAGVVVKGTKAQGDGAFIVVVSPEEVVVVQESFVDDGQVFFGAGYDGADFHQGICGNRLGGKNPTAPDFAGAKVDRRNALHNCSCCRRKGSSFSFDLTYSGHLGKQVN